MHRGQQTDVERRGLYGRSGLSARGRKWRQGANGMSRKGCANVERSRWAEWGGIGRLERFARRSCGVVSTPRGNVTGDVRRAAIPRLAWLIHPRLCLPISPSLVPAISLLRITISHNHSNRYHSARSSTTAPSFASLPIRCESEGRRMKPTKPSTCHARSSLMKGGRF
jgi:hypothetical protein